MVIRTGSCAATRVNTAITKTERGIWRNTACKGVVILMVLTDLRTPSYQARAHSITPDDGRTNGPVPRSANATIAIIVDHAFTANVYFAVSLVAGMLAHL